VLVLFCITAFAVIALFLLGFTAFGAIIALGLVPLWLAHRRVVIERKTAADWAATWLRDRNEQLSAEVKTNDVVSGFVSSWVILVRRSNSRYVALFRDELEPDVWRFLCTALRLQRDEA
jgi:hypothetical protein